MRNERQRYRTSVIWPLFLVVVLSGSQRFARGEQALQDDFSDGNSDGWAVKEGQWSVRDGKAVAEAGFARLIERDHQSHDFVMTAEVTYSHNDAHAAAGLLFRYRDDRTGYAVCVREIEKGAHPELGPWERPVIQLFRFDTDGWKLLQESKVEGCRSNRPNRLKVACKGPMIWVFYEDLTSPVFSEFDSVYDRSGSIGLWKDHLGTATFDDITVSDIQSVPLEPLRTDWSHVRGAVYVRSNAVNSVQMWHDYWDHTDVIDRELSAASLFGFNMVQVYVHWIVWDRHQEEYLARIEDFLSRSARCGLSVNIILWDDCGQVEPSLTFDSPIYGRHNSQMMPNPSHRIRDSRELLEAHKERFRMYVTGIVGQFKNDERIAFWQLYNEGMGARERYRTAETDGNLNRLLAWTKAWVKGTGAKQPVTATGGGFFGPKYSDFYSFHSYGDGKQPLPNSDGGSEHLCTETLCRPAVGLADCLRDLAAKQTGFVVWELMIGRDNCRFPWGHPDGLEEPSEPFHGVIYPDGHPWDVREIEVLLGQKEFAAMMNKVFRVEYFIGQWETKKKESIATRIDFDLGDEPGFGSPDSSAGIDKDNFSIRWTGKLAVPSDGKYTFFAESDGVVRLWIDEKLLIEKTRDDRREKTSVIELKEKTRYDIRIDYFHQRGMSHNRINLSGPGIRKQVLKLGMERDTVSMP